MNNLQAKILEIYKEVKTICDRNNIPYYAIGGTAIGAIRHKGFIPWDDDLDIAIPIEYWDFFIEKANEQLPKQLYVYTAEEHEHFHYMFIKVCDKTTTFIEDLQKNLPDTYKGIFIDIMPLSGIPTNTAEQKRFLKKIRQLYLHNFRIRFRQVCPNITRYINLIPYKLISLVIPYNRFYKKYFIELKKYPLSGSELTGYVWSTFRLPRWIFPAEWFQTTIEVDFEDTKINLPVGYDQYLTAQFGDYMKLPPVQERCTHAGTVHLDIPYTDYLNGKRKIGD